MTIAEIIAAKKAKQGALPGKRSQGLVLSASTPLPSPVPAVVLEPEIRSLSLPQGEAIPMTPTSADKEEATWHEALNSFESSLCVMRDKDEPEVIWLAVRAERAGLPPILLHRLPWLLWDYPMTINDSDIPY
jgi:hypothetical protein